MRCTVVILSLGALLLCAGCADALADPAGSPGQPLVGLPDRELGRFLLGQAVFERIATPEEGLGPFFNADRCSSCHETPAVGGGGSLLVVKATRWEDGRCDLLEEEGGDNIRQRSTPALRRHGFSSVPLPANATATAAVTSPPLFGLGLVEAVPDADLLALADPDDANGDGIRGIAARLPDGSVARFGRKGETATIAGFIDTALRFEMGLTTSVFPHEDHAGGRHLPLGVDPLEEPEIDEEGMELLVAFVRFLAPTARLQPSSAAARDSVAAGERLFSEVGCASCHVPELRTGPSEAAALDRRPVRAYSDFLLHDLGPGLATVCGARAGPSQWRTAPLWGLRHRERYLHDGRAADLETAIRQHGGEAMTALRAWEALDAASKSRLLAFLRSL